MFGDKLQGVKISKMDTLIDGMSEDTTPGAGKPILKNKLASQAGKSPQ